jgi:Ni/Co efflux regulator RcnB
MKRTAWMAAALALTWVSATGAALAQDHHDEHHDEHGAPHEGAAHPQTNAPNHSQPANSRVGDFHGATAPQGPAFHGPPSTAHFDGFRGQGYGPHAPAQFVYHGRSFGSFRVAPFAYPPGWGYRSWAYGQFLPALFLTPSYFIGNWGGYGLWTPPYGCNWVRYGPDALLVNVYTGQVVEVVHGVFWW